MARYKPDALTHELIQSLSTSDFNFILEYVKDSNLHVSKSYYCVTMETAFVSGGPDEARV